VPRSIPALRLRGRPLRGTRTPLVTVGGSRRRLLVVATISALACAGLYGATVLTPAGQLLGDFVLAGRPASNPRALGAAQDALATVSLGMLAGATVALGALALLAGRPRLALAVVIDIAGANLTAQLLKATLGRPDLIGTAPFGYGNSFPSGHVAVAASLALAALLVAPRRLRGLTALGGAVYVAVVAVSTLTAGWHRLADGIGAILIALAWAAGAAGVLSIGSGIMPRRSWRAGTGRASAVLSAVLGGGSLVFGAGLVAAAWLESLPGSVPLLGAGQAPAAFFGALAVVAGAALLAGGTLLWAMRGVDLEPRA
jgi:membrane-associated phospholipid phosphatase